ncbi:MAG: hypothetical protein Q7T82_02665 [Armatimonadota bacterium]|nr:hypothetical protein [Armatimonadota bacterium]
MTNPFSPRLKAPVLVLALLVMAFAATAAVADCGLARESGSAASAMPASSMSTMYSSESSGKVGVKAGATLGFASVSSLNENAWLVKGGPTSDTLAGIHGVIGFSARDLSDVRSATPSDSIEYGLARIHDPSDDSAYEVRFTGIDKSADAKFGGVGLLKPIFGGTGIGEAGLPETVAYVAAWGMADIFKNGQRIASNVPAHVVVTPGIRDTISGKLLAASDLDLSAREIMLHVPGPVSGLPDGMLMALWPSAALDLNGIGGRPLSRQAVAMAPVSGFPVTGRVLGEAAMVTPRHVQFSLTRNGFISYVPAAFSTGYTRVTVVNNSNVSRGAIISARDVIGSQLIRYTPILRPGKSFSFYTYIGPGNFKVMECHGGVMRGLRHWRSSYQTSFTVAR